MTPNSPELETPVDNKLIDNKTGRAFHAGDLISLDGYRSDGRARPLVIKAILGDRFIGQCIVRSTPVQTVVRTYVLAHIDGVRPLLGDE